VVGDPGSDKRLVHNLVRDVPGVIEVVDQLAWQTPDPKAGAGVSGSNGSARQVSSQSV
jgi:hypothetical protein